MSYFVFVSHKQKKTLIIDQKKIRYDHMRKRVMAWVKTINPASSLYMITLTYRPGDDYVKRDISVFIDHFVKYYRKRGLVSYGWVAELQERGVIHYHFIAEFKKPRRLRKPDKCGWWKHGLTRVEKAKSPYYLVSYLKKGTYQKDFDRLPIGARCFAVVQYVVPLDLRFYSLSSWKQSIVISEGWQALPFYMKMRKEIDGWIPWSIHDDLPSALSDMQSWHDDGYACGGL